MICFLDRSFCSSEAHKPDCQRILTPELQRKAEKWWGGKDYPVSYRNFCDDAAEIN